MLDYKSLYPEQIRRTTREEYEQHTQAEQIGRGGMLTRDHLPGVAIAIDELFAP